MPEIPLSDLEQKHTIWRKSSKGFSAMFDEIKRRTADWLSQQSQTRFSTNVDIFVDIPDSHTLSIICSHHGLSISALKPGKIYDVHGKDPLWFQRLPMIRIRMRYMI